MTQGPASDAASDAASRTPAAAMPWVVNSPFRMRPGLARLVAETPPPLFLRDGQAAAYAVHKARVLDQAPERAQIGRPDADVLQAIASAYAAQTGIRLAADARALGFGLQEDFVILHDEPGDGFRTRFLSVCFPSNWDPREKIGLDFPAIHAPVADNALLQAGAKGIVDLAFRQAAMERHVWLLTPNGALAQHPLQRHTRWEDALNRAGAHGRLLDQVFYRVERQTTLPLPALRHGVFFIRVLVAPLVQVLREAPGRATDLHQALASMSEAVIAYRGMGAVRERLLQELPAFEG